MDIKDVEIECFRVKETVYDRALRNWVTAPMDKYTYRYEPVEKLLNKLRDFKPSAVLKDGMKVYFDKSVIFPRRKFTSSFPNNTIAKSAATADIVMLDVKRLGLEYNYYSKYTAHIDGDSIYRFNYEYRSSKGEKYYVGAIGNKEVAEKNLARLKALGSFDFDKIADGSRLSTKSDLTMDADAFEKISTMLSAGDDEVIGMGLRMLSAYDYDTEKVKISMLLCLHESNLRKSTVNKNSIEVRTMLDRIKREYGTFHRMGEHAMSRFWFNIILDHPEDMIVSRKFSDFMKRYVDEEVKLVKV